MYDEVADACERVDCVIVCVPDDALSRVVRELAAHADTLVAAGVRVVSTSSFGGVALLQPLADAGCPVGVLHPMASIVTGGSPDALFGAGAAIGCRVDAMRTMLHALAHALGMLPFDLDEDGWPLHAAACTLAAIGPIAMLAGAADLATRAGAHPGVASAAYGRLAEQAAHRTIQLDPVAALAGPIVRGDAAAVAAQLRSVREVGSYAEALYIPVLATMSNRALDEGRISEAMHRALLEAVLDPTQFINDEEQR